MTSNEKPETQDVAEHQYHQGFEQMLKLTESIDEFTLMSGCGMVSALVSTLYDSALDEGVSAELAKYYLEGAFHASIEIINDQQKCV